MNAKPTAAPKSRRPAGRSRRGGWLIKVGLSLVVLVGAGALFIAQRRNASAGAEPAKAGAKTTKARAGNLRWRVQKTDLTISTLSPGEMRTKNITQIRNEAQTSQQLKITWIAPEGSRVQAGDKLVELDATTLRENYLQQKIKQAEAAEKTQQAKDNLAIAESQSTTDIQAANNNVKIAEIDLKKYEQGDYQQELRKKESAVTIADEELKRANDKLEWTEKLFAKGYVTENDLEADRLAVIKTGIALKTAQEDLKLLKEFVYEKDITKFKTVLIEAQGKRNEVTLTWEKELNSRKATVDTAIERSKLEEETTKNFEDQLAQTVIKAPSDGLVVYYKDRGRFGSQDSVLQVGSSVYARQRLIDLPDFSSWIIEARVHESMIQQVKIGQRAFASMDAFPDTVLTGTVSKMSVLPDNSQWFRDTQEYLVEISLDQNMPTFKPGMSGKCEIIIKELKGVLAVPIQAVAVQDGKTIVNRVGEAGAVMQEVKVGESNDRFVEIVEGLSEGQEVLLDSAATTSKAPLGSRPAERASGDQRDQAADAAASVKDRAQNPAREGEGGDRRGEGREGGNGDGGGENGGGRGRRQRMDPSQMSPEQLEEAKKRMEERMKDATPEERAEMEKRMKAFMDSAGQGAGNSGGAGQAPAEAPREGGPGAAPAAPAQP